MSTQPVAASSSNALARWWRALHSGVYGSFYILSKKMKVYNRLAVLGQAINLLQMLSFLASRNLLWYQLPSVEWLRWAGKIVSVQGFAFLDSLVVYLAVFYVSVGIVAVFVVLFAYCMYAFMTAHFPVLWPVRLLSAIGSLAASELYIPLLSTLLTNFQCYRNTKDTVPYWQQAGYLCYQGGHLAQTIVTIFLLIGLISLAMEFALLFFDPFVLSRSVAARSHGRSDFLFLLMKTVLVIFVQSFPETVGTWGVIVVLLLCGLVWLGSTLYFMASISHMQNRINAAAAMVFVVGAVAVAICQGTGVDGGILLYLTSPLSFVGGVAMADWRAKSIHFRPVQRLQNAIEVDLKVRYMVHSLLYGHHTDKLHTITEAMASRRGSKGAADAEEVAAFIDSPYLDPDDVATQIAAARQVLTKAHLAQIEAIYRSGCQRFKASSFLHLTVARYYSTLSFNRHMEMSHLMQAERCSPLFDVGYMIFQARKKQEDVSGSKGQMSALARVTFEKHLADARRNTMKAIQQQVAFWNELSASIVDLTRLHGIAAQMTDAEQRAEASFTELLALNNQSLLVLRLYSEFTLRVRNNGEKATLLVADAERIEEAAAKEHAREAGTVMRMMAESPLDVMSDATGIITISGNPQSLGTITSANSIACRIFGYSRWQLERRNINCIVPPPMQEVHDNFLKRYLASGEGSVVDYTRCLLALHKNGCLIPVLITVRESLAADSTAEFVGLLRPLATAENHIILDDKFNVVAATQTSFTALDIEPQTLRSRTVSLREWMPDLDEALIADLLTMKGTPVCIDVAHARRWNQQMASGAGGGGGAAHDGGSYGRFDSAGGPSYGLAPSPDSHYNPRAPPPAPGSSRQSINRKLLAISGSPTAPGGTGTGTGSDEDANTWANGLMQEITLRSGLRFYVFYWTRQTSQETAAARRRMAALGAKKGGGGGAAGIGIGFGINTGRSVPSARPPIEAVPAAVADPGLLVHSADGTSGSLEAMIRFKGTGTGRGSTGRESRRGLLSGGEGLGQGQGEGFQLPLTTSAASGSGRSARPRAPFTLQQGAEGQGQGEEQGSGSGSGVVSGSGSDTVAGFPSPGQGPDTRRASLPGTVRSPPESQAQHDAQRADFHRRSPHRHPRSSDGLDAMLFGPTPSVTPTATSGDAAVIFGTPPPSARIHGQRHGQGEGEGEGLVAVPIPIEPVSPLAASSPAPLPLAAPGQVARVPSQRTLLRRAIEAAGIGGGSSTVSVSASGGSGTRRGSSMEGGTGMDYASMGGPSQYGSTDGTSRHASSRRHLPPLPGSSLLPAATEANALGVGTPLGGAPATARTVNSESGVQGPPPTGSLEGALVPIRSPPPHKMPPTGADRGQAGGAQAAGGLALAAPSAFLRPEIGIGVHDSRASGAGENKTPRTAGNGSGSFIRGDGENSSRGSSSNDSVATKRLISRLRRVVDDQDDSSLLPSLRHLRNAGVSVMFSALALTTVAVIVSDINYGTYSKNVQVAADATALLESGLRIGQSARELAIHNAGFVELSDWSLDNFLADLKGQTDRFDALRSGLYAYATSAGRAGLYDSTMLNSTEFYTDPRTGGLTSEDHAISFAESMLGYVAQAQAIAALGAGNVSTDVPSVAYVLKATLRHSSIHTALNNSQLAWLHVSLDSRTTVSTLLTAIYATLAGLLLIVGGAVLVPVLRFVDKAKDEVMRHFSMMPVAVIAKLRSKAMRDQRHLSQADDDEGNSSDEEGSSDNSSGGEEGGQGDVEDQGPPPSETESEDVDWSKLMGRKSSKRLRASRGATSPALSASGSEDERSRSGYSSPGASVSSKKSRRHVPRSVTTTTVGRGKYKKNCWSFFWLLFKFFGPLLFILAFIVSLYVEALNTLDVTLSAGSVAYASAQRGILIMDAQSLLRKALRTAGTRREIAPYVAAVTNTTADLEYFHRLLSFGSVAPSYETAPAALAGTGNSWLLDAAGNQRIKSLMYTDMCAQLWSHDTAAFPDTSVNASLLAQLPKGTIIAEFGASLEECRTVLGGVQQRSGFHGALLDYLKEIRRINDLRASADLDVHGHGVLWSKAPNGTEIAVPFSAQQLFADSVVDALSSCGFQYLPRASFLFAAEFQNAATSSVNSFVLAQSISCGVCVLAFVLFVVFYFVPSVIAENRAIRQQRAILLLLPPGLFRSSQALKQLLTGIMQTSASQQGGSGGSVEGAPGGPFTSSSKRIA